jgi:hypothetical protein
MSLHDYKKSLHRPQKVLVMKSIKENTEMEEQSNQTPLPKMDKGNGTSS